MPSVKLTNDIRTRIKAAYLRPIWEKINNYEANNKPKINATRLILERYGDTIQKAKKLQSELASNLGTYNGVDVHFEINGLTRSLRDESVDRTIPRLPYWEGGSVTLPYLYVGKTCGPLTPSEQEAVETYYGVIDGLNQDLASAEKFLTELLYNCTTLKRLQDAWPEVDKYLPEDVVMRMKDAVPADTKDQAQALNQMSLKASMV